jgi:DNA-binding transcriptional MerR regulator
MTERAYKSIGEVLGLLLEEFPNVTISKIRFLESQGLIEPERTPSGYRKFTDDEVERLRYILREQETNYLPLRVIRDRLDESGAIPRDPTAPTSLPPALRNQTVGDVSRELARIHKLNVVSNDDTGAIDESMEIEIDPVVLAESERLHPASRRAPQKPPAKPVAAAVAPITASTGGPVSLEDLCELSGLSVADLRSLEQFGLMSSRQVGGDTFYEASAREVSVLAKGFLDLGIDIRHLKSWRLAAEKEAALFEQRLMPLLRQKNPEARSQSAEMLATLVSLAGDLRRVLVQQAVGQFIEPRQ